MKQLQIILSLLIVSFLVSSAHAETCTPSQRTDLATAGYKKAEIEKMCSGTISSTPSQLQHQQAEVPSGNYISQGGLNWMPINSSLITFADANSYCTNTAINGKTGWRLPTVDELSSLYASGEMNDQGWTLDYTWSSTPDDSGFHNSVSLLIGVVFSDFDADNHYVTCVLEP